MTDASYRGQPRYDVDMSAVGGLRQGRLFLVLLLLGAGPGVAGATTVPYRTDAELVALSERVVHARVVSSAAERTAIGVETVTSLLVLEDLTGMAGDTIELREIGGEVAGVGMWVPGVPGFRAGQEVVLCLERARGAWRTVALSFSVFLVQRNAGEAGARLLRFRSDLAIQDAPASAPPARSLDEFRRIVVAVKGVQPWRAERQATGDLAVPDVSVDEPFTLLDGGIRWQEVNAGAAIPWFRNTAAPSPLAGGDTDAEIATALAAWTRVSTASIVLTFGGARADGGQAAGGNYCSAANAGAGLITFGNLGNLVPSGALAVGAGCFDPLTSHLVNGHRFRRFTHAFVVFNTISGSYTSTPDFTQVLTHEIGHGLGLGHPCTSACTSPLVVNVMFPACCFSDTPVPPALGPDDRDGLAFIYPEPDEPTCSLLVTPTQSVVPIPGSEGTLTVTASGSTCAWTAASSASWLVVVSGASGTGHGTIRYLARANYTMPARTATISVRASVSEFTQPADSDLDADGLSDAWEERFGLDPRSAIGVDGADGDPDGDGIANGHENAQLHPRGFVSRYLAEGAVNAFFSTRLSLLNPGTVNARVNVRLLRERVNWTQWFVLLPAGASRTLDAPFLGALAVGIRTGAFSVIVESDVPLVVDRTMTWDGSGYGAHAESAVEGPSSTWYFAEGSTSGEFSLFYLLLNPLLEIVNASVRFLLPAPSPPVDVPFVLLPWSRLTLQVDRLRPELASTDVSAIVTAEQPILAERAMYLSRPDQPFAAGHASAGLPAPATEWFLAEGATGPFFELFLLVANPGSTQADVQVEYLRPGGPVLSKSYTVAATSRLTIWVDEEEFPAGSGNKALASDSVSMRVRSTNGVPIVVERTMWWPQPDWHEAHNETGTTDTGTRWALADAEVGGPSEVQTFVLIANPSATAGLAQVTLHFEDATTASRIVPMAPTSRTTVSMAELFPAAANRRFGVTVQSAPLPGGSATPPIVVERAMYWNHQGVLWAAGTVALATRLTP